MSIRDLILSWRRWRDSRRLVSNSRTAVRRAYEAALASGHSVLVSKGGVIYEVHPDGTRRELKKIEPPIPMAKGQKISL